MYAIILFAFIGQSSAVFTNYYDSYTGNQITLEDVRRHNKENNTFWCVNEIEQPCDPNGWRRIDGSCNNLKYFTRGAPHTRVLRLLPPVYDKGFEPRLAKNGEPLPLCRAVRTSALLEGSVSDQRFTQLFTHLLVFATSDIVAVQDTVKYVVWKTYCCEERGKKDRDCTPNKVPDNDPVHRFSSVRCMNLTRPESFQSVGCVRNDTVPERIVSATAAFDLSQIYGAHIKTLNEKGRLFTRGLLKSEVEKGKIWPPSSKGPSVCLLNQKPYETRCHATPEDGLNTILGANLFGIWIWREHNRIASELYQINPCWDDDTLFYATRDIVIASMMQIYFYEMFPLLLGRDNMMSSGVISPYQGLRDVYRETVQSEITVEFPFVMRYLHMMQEGKLKMYDAQGYHLKDMQLANLTLRTGYLVDHLEGITQGSFRQPAAKIDYAVDPDMAETVLGPHQYSSDVFTSDCAKNRLFGFESYVKYRQLCFGGNYRKFEDLRGAFAPERLEKLKEIYKHIEDIDLIVGIWLENYISGGLVSETFYCVVIDQLFRSVVSDRHWYERPNRPHAFTYEQLQEIRKSTVAGLMCNVGDTVTHIQPQAFLRIGHYNPLVSCEYIPKMNFNAWKDEMCSSEYPSPYTPE